MGFIFEGLLEGTITLAVLYALLAIGIYRKLIWVQAKTPQGLNTRKLFVMTVLLVSILRFMSFASMTLLALGSVDFHLEEGTANNDDDGSIDGDKDFFNKAMVALFDFPDFYFISAYVLQVIVWAEAYLKSRRHWLSSQRFNCFWVWSYFLFNVLLYTCQIALYSLLFIPTIDHYVETDLIYLTLAGFNIALPVGWMVLYLYLTLVFSGFPFASPAAIRRLTRLTQLVFIWTVTRLSWGIVALSSVLQDWITEVHKSSTFYTIVLVCIFLIVEILPIYISLKSTSIQLLAEIEEPRPNERGTPTPSTNYSNIFVIEQHSPLLDATHRAEDRESIDSDQYFLARPGRDAAERRDRSSFVSMGHDEQRPSHQLSSDRGSDAYGSAQSASDGRNSIGERPAPSLWERISGFHL